MRAKKPLPDYSAPESSSLTIENNTIAAIQQVVGGLVLPGSQGEPSNDLLGAARAGLASPSAVGSALAWRATCFKEQIESWKRLTSRLLSGRTTPNTAQSLLKLLDQIEPACLDLPILLGRAREALQSGLLKLEPEAVIFLGIPTPISDDDLTGQTATWNERLEQLGAMVNGQDSDLAALIARSCALAAEILETLRESGKLAKWLWTNQPTPERLTSLVQWMWDLHCECQELATCCGCLRPGLSLWDSKSR